jgi:predicted RNA-binding protein YlxR (DUF448 family)
MKIVPSVHELRKQGYKVRVTHIRKFQRFDPRTGKKIQFYAPFQSNKFLKNHPEAQSAEPAEENQKFDEFFLSAKGGETIVEIGYRGKEIGRGVAVCSEYDPYVKKYGVKKAVAMALKTSKINQDPYAHLRKLFYNKSEKTLL